jgi:phosphoribosylpyrophosphate synthetase
MLVRSSSISALKPDNPPAESDNSSENSCDNQYQDYIHYTKFSLVSRRDLFIIAFYKTENLEKFKGNIANADILAPLLATLLQYYIPDIENSALITTPKRAHSEKLGYHFASEICIRACKMINLEFIPDVLIATSKSKFNPNFIQQKPLPEGKRVILFDDIATTYQTIYATLNVLRSNPENNLAAVHVPIFVGINNN